MKRSILAASGVVALLGTLGVGVALGSALSDDSSAKVVAQENTQLLQQNHELLQKTLATEESLQGRTIDLNKARLDYDQLLQSNAKLEKQVKELQSQDNCLNSSVFAQTDSGFVYQVGESQLCGTNLHFGKTIYGPSIDAYIDGLKQDNALLQKKCGDACK